MIYILLDAIIDSLKLIPFLYVTYLLLEYLEHKTSKHMHETIKKAGKFGPIIGGILGIVPQCGFSVAATNFYAVRVITLGTLISVYLTTSDEMLPILLSESIPITTIIAILAVKLFVGIIAGFIIDLIIVKTKNEEEHVVEFCEKEHCHCEHGIIKSAIKHTLNILVFIFIITLLLNIVIEFIGEDTLSNLIYNTKILGPLIAGLIGLIPNCAASVLLSQLYIEGIISAAILISGLLVNAGIGVLVLLRVNKDIKENIKIIGILYFIGVIVGIFLQLINFTI
ncbi:MAG: arsenic efflux protein [Clostridia bacterium]|nr:arsenic efflux protein [Clostridia bacterium]